MKNRTWFRNIARFVLLFGKVVEIPHNTYKTYSSRATFQHNPTLQINDPFKTSRFKFYNSFPSRTSYQHFGTSVCRPHGHFATATKFWQLSSDSCRGRTLEGENDDVIQYRRQTSQNPTGHGTSAKSPQMGSKVSCATTRLREEIPTIPKALLWFMIQVTFELWSYVFIL